MEKIPQHEPIRCDTLDDETWDLAIKSLKSGSARGVDAWAPDELKMLPSKPLTDLKDAFSLLASYGMPTYLMQAKVIPLSKKEGNNNASNTRPITVLALLYRLWSKMASTIILQRFSNTFPSSITGFLPSRKDQTFLYNLQFQIEVALKDGSNESWGGLTLDLVKCFNTLQHKPCDQILRRLGVPEVFITFWIQSIQRMQRFWLIRNETIASSRPNCGFPEGDCMSIVAMLAVSRLWVQLIQVEHLLPHSFADNWSWVTNNHLLHRQTMEKTLQLAKAIRLTIDWEKTWIWGTTKIHTQTLQNVRTDLLNDNVQLQTVQHARELGHIIHYQLLPYRGTQKERHTQALTRLRKLAKHNWPIDDLAHIAQTACLTKALYGIETYACGDKYFQQLRTTLAAVLVGPYANTNPYIAVMCASSYVKDPELIAIQQAIKAARDFHYATNREHEQSFFYHCATSTAQPAQVIGPAGALKFYLAKLAWQIDKQGYIHVDAYITLHILDASLEIILQATELAWLQNMTTVAYTKKGQQNGPPINRFLTLRLLESFANHDRKMILREIAGSRMDEHQKSTFVPENEGSCLCCGQQDSVEHRVLKCDATEHIRTGFPEMMDHLNEYDIIHTHLPVIFMHPDWEFDRFLHFHATLPEIPESFHQTNKISLYTDGSCQFPDLFGRWTAFAVVQPIVKDEEILAHMHLPIPEIAEKCFKIVAVSQGKGPQTIPRAELQALITAFRYDPTSRVVTDSAYALDALRKVCQAEKLSQLHMLPNFDLLQELHQLVLSNVSLHAEKIKAHENFHSENKQITLDRIGNAVADYAANSSCKSLAEPLVTWRRNRCLDDENMLRLRRTHYVMLLALMAERTKQQNFQEERSEMAITPVMKQTSPDHLTGLKLEQFQQYSFPPNGREVALASRFGQQPSFLVMKYLALLKWPQEPELEPVPIGISWLELYFNFQVVTGATMPVNVAARGEDERLVWMDEQQVFTVDSFPYDRYVQYFRFCVEHLQKFQYSVCGRTYHDGRLDRFMFWAPLVFDKD